MQSKEIKTAKPKTRAKIPRFSRVPERVGRFRLKDEDLEILKLCYENRWINSAQLRALLLGSPTSDSARARALSGRLRDLYDSGYLDRPLRSQWGRLKTEFHQRSYPYALSKFGAKLLAQRGLLEDEEPGRLSLNNQRAKAYFIFHELGISQFKTTLTLALRQSRLAKLHNSFPKGFLQERVEIRGKGRGYQRRPHLYIPIIPDWNFSLLSVLRSEKAGKLAFFHLEYETSSRRPSRFKRKLQAYWNLYLAMKKENKRHPLGAPNFRVLTVTSSEEYLDWIPKGYHRILMRVAAEVKPSLMFYFTTEDAYSLQEPERILGKIWLSPADKNYHSILE